MKKGMIPFGTITPQKRAIDLYTKMYSVGYNSKSDEEREARAKYFAALICDKVLANQIPDEWRLYWCEVKKEVENL